MILILNVLLFLAIVSVIAGTIAARLPSGPEGQFGIWFLLMFPCLFVALLVFVFVAKGSLNFVPGGGFVQFVIAVGILITFSTVVFGRFDRHSSVIQGLLIAVPYLIIAGCAATIHQSSLPDPRLGQCLAAILLGGAALVGWGLAGWGFSFSLQRGMGQAALQQYQEQTQEEQYHQNQAAAYAKLDESAPLWALLWFTWSRNDQVRQQARIRASRLPDLNDKLIELLDQGFDDAISYIAGVYENPPAKLAPAWTRMLKRKLKAWNSLQYDPHAATWEQNLMTYFQGAKKIQVAGGSFHPELVLWYRHLQKCKGLGNLVVFVGDMLQTESKSK